MRERESLFADPEIGWPWYCECTAAGRRSKNCQRCLTCGANAPWVRWPTHEDYAEEMADAQSY